MKSATEAAIIAVASAMLAFNYDRQEMPYAAFAWMLAAGSWTISTIIRLINKIQ